MLRESFLSYLCSIMLTIKIWVEKVHSSRVKDVARHQGATFGSIRH